MEKRIHRWINNTYTSSIFGWNILFINPIDGDLNGYFSGKSTRTFQTPPSYDAKWIEMKQKIRINTTRTIQKHIKYILPFGPKNLTQNSFRPPKIVTSCLDSILFIGKKKKLNKN